MSKYNVFIYSYSFLLQTDMHLCAAKCCQDSNASVDSVQNCVDRCSQPLTRAQNYVQHELGEFQGRLQRCVMVSNCKNLNKNRNNISLLTFFPLSNATMILK